MYILAIDTTGPVGTVCLGTVPESTFPVKVTTETMSHLRNLMPMISELLEDQKVDKSDITAVAASCGPGSFTGIRIGVSTARALAQAWDVPCIQVPTLEVFRQKCSSACQDSEAGAGNEAGESSEAGDGDESGKGTDGSVCAVFNARRGQVYAACFGSEGETLIEPGPYMLDEILTKIEELGIRPEFYGDGIDAYFDTDEFRERVASYKAAPKESRYQTAAMTAKYAIKKWEEGETVEYGKLLPDYMRESEAEQRLKDGSLEKMRKEKMERFMRMAGEK